MLEIRPSESIAIELDKYSRTPIYEQVVEQCKRLILTGEWQADDPLPSVRTLSAALGVNPNTLQKAFSELDRMNLTYTVAGNGRFVHPDAYASLSASETEQVKRQIAALLGRLVCAGQSKEEILAMVSKLLDGNP